MGKGRWGLGMLDLSRRAEAIPGELLTDTNIGLTATKIRNGGVEGETGDVVSYEYISRVNQGYQRFHELLASESRTGHIYKLDLDDLVGPKVMESGKLVGASTLAISDKKLAYIKFFLDVDVIERESGLPVRIDPTVALNFSTMKNRETEQGTLITVSQPVSELNARAFIPDYTGFDAATSDATFSIETIGLTIPDEYVNKTTICLHSLFVAFKEVAES